MRPRKTGPPGVEMIKHFESFRDKAYQDEAGIWTIGYGTISIAGTPVTKDMVCSQEHAIQWMLNDIARFEVAVSKAINPELPQHKFDALVCFTYNVGIGALNSSTIRRKINTDIPVVEKNFTDWCKINVKGKLVPSVGLIRRRKAEFNLYQTGNLQFFFDEKEMKTQ